MKALITVFYCLISIASAAQKSPSIDKDKDRINKVCDSFMQLFVENKISDAIQLIKSNSVIEKDKLDTLQVAIQQQLEYILTSYGKVIGYELVAEKKIKDVLCKRFYILSFKNYYLKFEFMLYKREKVWTITNFKFNDEVDNLLM